jgi:tetratricopeptide (TPR) repeat protein
LDNQATKYWEEIPMRVVWYERRPQRAVVARRLSWTALLALLPLTGSMAGALRLDGAEPPAQLTEQQRAELGRRAGELNRRAFKLYGEGRYDESIRLLEQALRLIERVYPKESYPHGDSDLADILSNLAYLHRVRGDYGAARPLYERALAMNEGLYPKDKYPKGHPDLALSLDNLADVHTARGDLEAGLPLRERALAMREALYPTDQYPHGHPLLANSLTKLAYQYRERGDTGRPGRCTSGRWP